MAAWVGWQRVTFFCCARASSLGLWSQAQVWNLPATCHLTANNWRQDHQIMTGKANNICVFFRPPICGWTPEPMGLPRLDVTYIRFYGYAERMNDESDRTIWQGGQEVITVAYERHDHWLRNLFYQQFEVVGEQTQARI